jgi:hypothetical protein
VVAPAAPPQPPTEASPFFSRLSGLFSGDLPELNLPDTIKLTFRPHFGDPFNRDYMRVESGVRWALSEHFELRTGASAFFTHGFRDSAGYGIGQLSGGARYIFRDAPWQGYETIVDVGYVAPVGHPPVDMTDGFTHFQPSFIVQHLTDFNPRLTLFTGMGLDIVNKTSIPGTFGTNQPHDSVISTTAGGVYDAGQIKWTFTAIYANSVLVGVRARSFVYLQPGLLWYVPRKYTFHSRTQWIAGLGANASWGPDGMHFGASTRLRAEITFRQVMDKIRSRPEKAAPDED